MGGPFGRCAGRCAGSGCKALRRDGSDYDVVSRSERPAATISPRSATGVAIASLVGGLSSYIVLLVAARTLLPARNAEFLAFWSLTFWVFGVLGGVQNESTRAVAAVRLAAADLRSGDHVRGTPVLPPSLIVGLAVAVIVGVSSLLWGRTVLGDNWPVLVLIVCLAGTAFAGQSAIAGSLAGSADWTAFAWTTAAEPTTRLVLVLGVAAAGSTSVGLEAASGAAAATWVLLVAVSRRARAGARAHADVDLRTFVAHVCQTLVAATASAALVVGFTVLLRATSTAAEYSMAAPFILAISVTRAPLLIPLTAYQGVAINYFFAHRAAGIRALWPSVRMVLAGGIVATVAISLVGAWGMQVLFGEAYRVPGVQLGALTLAATCMALVTLTGAATLAVGKHRAYAVGWVLASLVSVGLLLLPLPLVTRGILALAVGPLLGATVHAMALVGPSRKAR